MLTKNTYKTFVTKHFTLALISSFSGRASASYDTDLGTVTTELQIEGQGKSVRVLDVNRLLTCIAEFRVQPADFASQETVALASAISFLADSGRIVTDHESFQSMADKRQVALSELLPRWEAPTLSWFELRFTNGKLGFVPQTWKIN
jgi:hypothetical protein